MSISSNLFPKVLYISDVPVVDLYSGSAMMYHLLETFPKDKLMVYQSPEMYKDKQLPGVPYYYHQSKFTRLQATRFSDLFNLVNIFINCFFIPQVLRSWIKKEKPEGILTVAHGLLWVLAYKIARKAKVPLIICIHDDINAHYPQKRLVGRVLHYYFKKAYQYASVRFCISELMRKEYLKTMNTDGQVLYPLQRKQTYPLCDNKNRRSKGITVAYAGTLHVGDYLRMLDQLAQALSAFQSRLILYSDYLPEILAKHENVIYGGFVAPDNILKVLCEQSDILFLPFAFHGTLNNTHLAFPSKAADYTSLGKPLLVWASDECATGQWFDSLTEKPGVWIKERENTAALNAAIATFLNDSQRDLFGRTSVNIGKKYFNYDELQDLFITQIKKHTR